MHRKSAQKKYTGKMHRKSAESSWQQPATSSLLYFSIALHVTGSHGVPYYIIVFI